MDRKYKCREIDLLPSIGKVIGKLLSSLIICFPSQPSAIYPSQTRKLGWPNSVSRFVLEQVFAFWIFGVQHLALIHSDILKI